MTVASPETPTVGLGQFIKQSKFRVPSHQRDYSWKEEYVKQFVDDVVRAMTDGEGIYFCGLMVFVREDATTYQVLDGQQRLATTIMLFAAVRNWFNTYSEFRDDEKWIDTQLLGERELGNPVIQPKLLLNSSNNDAFSQFIVNRVPLSDVKRRLDACKKHDRNRALLEATIYLNERVARIASGFGDVGKAKDYLIALVNFIINTVAVVRLVVDGEEAAYTIFETLNDRGMDLGALDLIKNFLFSRTDRRKPHTLRDMEGRWTEMMTILADKKADSFVRAFWASRQGTPEGARLFKPFKEVYKTPDQAYAVSLDLRRAAEHYVALTDPNDPTWSPYSDKARESVDALASFGSTQFFPIILAALAQSDFDPKEMERLLWLIEVLNVRFLIIGGGRPGRIESLGAITARAITEGRVKTATQARVELDELYVGDEEFKLNFQSSEEGGSRKVAYLLKGLEVQARRQGQDVHSTETAPHRVTIEHVLPKSPGVEWDGVLTRYPQFHETYLGRLGNLCLLSEVNRALGNKSFAEKKVVLETSNLRMTSNVATYDEWIPHSVDHRQRWMASLAAAYWRFQ